MAGVDSPFEILEIDPDADDDEVVDAYRRRVKEVHPDQGGSTREFRLVQTAYEKIQAGYEPGDPLPEEDESEPAPEPPEPEGNLVEYLDYEVMVDHGWELTDENLFERASEANLGFESHGRFYAQETESLLEAAENNGLMWPFACRGGACTNCAVAIIDGEMPSPSSHILPSDLHDRGIRLSCISAPVTDDTKIVFNIKHMPEVSELLLPASRFEQATSTE